MEGSARLTFRKRCKRFLLLKMMFDIQLDIEAYRLYYYLTSNLLFQQ
jgi:hypothetical protein